MVESTTAADQSGAAALRCAGAGAAGGAGVAAGRVTRPALTRARVVSAVRRRLGLIGAFLRGDPGLQAGVGAPPACGGETKLLRSRAGRAGSPRRRTGVHRPPA